MPHRNFLPLPLKGVVARLTPRAHARGVLHRLVLLALLVACSGPSPGASHGDATADGGTDLPPTRPDLQADRDTDGDGLLDVEEGYAAGRGPDTDGDGVADGEDLDSDGDGLPDALEALPRDARGAPFDADGDGLPDFRDRDSDGDSLLDEHEVVRAFDWDGDEVPNWRDLDSDADGLPDRDEAGDDDLETLPADTDDDGAPDFVDVDSDGDGLYDDEERALGLSATRQDTDDDGVRDMLEVLAGTDGTDPDDSPAARGWLLAVLPFREAPSPDVFRAALRFEVPEGDAPTVIGVQVRDVGGGAELIDHVEIDARSAGCAAAATRDLSGDGRDDTFVSPAAGSELCWTVTLRPNRTVPPEGPRHPVAECRTEGPVFLEAALDVLVDDTTARSARFLAWVPWDISLLGPDDPRCRDCGLSERCQRIAGCHCLFR